MSDSSASNRASSLLKPSLTRARISLSIGCVVGALSEPSLACSSSLSTLVSSSIDADLRGLIVLGSLLGSFLLFLQSATHSF
jgi:hypothetical protein